MYVRDVPSEELNGHTSILSSYLSHSHAVSVFFLQNGSNCVHLAAEGGHTTAVKELLEVYDCEISQEKVHLHTLTSDTLHRLCSSIVMGFHFAM